jgi:putative intracellular protease/amidase
VAVGHDAAGKPQFRLQARVTDLGKEGEIIFGAAHVPISMANETGLTYCPWCGRELVGWYLKDSKKLDRSDMLLIPV